MLQQVLHGMISNTLKMMRGITTIVLYTYILSTVSLPLFHLSIKHRFLLSFMYILISLSNNVIINYNFIVYSSPPSFYIFPFYLKLTSPFFLSSFFWLTLHLPRFLRTPHYPIFLLLVLLLLLFLLLLLIPPYPPEIGV